jgi:hypothetical protein
MLEQTTVECWGRWRMSARQAHGRGYQAKVPRTGITGEFLNVIIIKKGSQIYRILMNADISLYSALGFYAVLILPCRILD